MPRMAIPKTSEQRRKRRHLRVRRHLGGTAERPRLVVFRSLKHIYAQLVDGNGLVLGNQVTPIPVVLDGEEHTVGIPLEMVAHTLGPGDTVTLQIVASAVTYQALWSSGQLKVTSMTLTLPTADAEAINLPTEAVTVTAA